jgi:uncharacterized protein
MRQAQPVRTYRVVVWLIAAWAALALVSPSWAQDIKFPELTGRVVDQANLLAPDTRQALDAKLTDLENKSSIQFAVATVDSLQDRDVETYANLLFRKWGLGDKKKNNGVLLLVAPNQKKVRIEVGYGLEGVLTDALSKLIIVNGIAPRFKKGDYGGGITRGVDDVISILTTDASEWQKKPDLRKDSNESVFPALLILLVFIVVFIVIWRNQQRGGGGPFIYTSSSGGSSGSGWGSSSGSDFGGFSGGGGSSGGGGASGDW